MGSPRTVLLAVLGGGSLSCLHLRRGGLGTVSRLDRLCIHRLSVHMSDLRTYSPSRVFSRRIGRVVRTALHALPRRAQGIFGVDHFRGGVGGRVTRGLNVAIGKIRCRVSETLGRFQVSLGSCLPLFCFFFCFRWGGVGGRAEIMFASVIL